MSFDEIVQELPKLTGPELRQIAEKAEFLAALDEGLRQVKEGKPRFEFAPALILSRHT